jgi:hypothetical protein
MLVHEIDVLWAPTVISPTSHHGQWSGSSVKISGEERARWAIWLIAIYATEKNRTGSSEPTPGIVRGLPDALTFLPSKLHNTPLTMNGEWAHMSTSSMCPAWQGSKEGKPSQPWFWEACVAFGPQRGNPNKPMTWHNSIRGMQIS